MPSIKPPRPVPPPEIPNTKKPVGIIITVYGAIVMLVLGLLGLLLSSAH